VAKKAVLNKRLWMVGIHLGFIGVWVGTTVVLFVLTLMITWSIDADVRAAIPELVYVLDVKVMRCAGIGSILTGGILAASYWGFTRFYWVLLKELVSLSLVVNGATWLEPIEKKAASYISTQGSDALQNLQYLHVREQILWTLAIWIFVMVGMVYISKFKPWGKIRRTSQVG
jgi:hypothetical protein